MNDFTPLPASAPLGGFFWSWIVPALLFLIALAATWALYRHFSNGPDDGSGGPR